MQPVKSLETIGLILAGGQARRFEGQDKAFIELGGESLLARAMTQLGPQVDRLAISSNAPPARFSAYGVPILADIRPGFLGPLAGIHAALLAWPQAYLVTVAVDLPFLPSDLVARLKAGREGADCAYASTEGRHALAVLWRPGMADCVGAYLDQGKQSLKTLFDEHGRAVSFSADRHADLGLNINTPADLSLAEARLHPRR